MRIRFTVPGLVQSKGRPRFARQGNFVRSYTPEKTVEYENLVRLCYRQDYPDIRLSGALKATIYAYFPIPKSVSKKKHAEMAENKVLPITSSKDIDNCVKAILDALNGIAYDDDRQVVELHAYKLYSDTPRAEIEIEEIIEMSLYMNEPIEP